MIADGRTARRRGGRRGGAAAAEVPARGGTGWARALRGGRARVAAAVLRPRVLLAAIALLILLGLGWMWLRDSSLVAVDKVAIIGASGPDAPQIRQALEASAHNMTTLDVSIGQLRTAVEPYPVVKDLSVTTQFPHGMRIRVIEQVPVAAVVVAGQRTAVAADGTLLHDVVAPSSLPSIPVQVPPGGSRLTESGARQAVAVLAAAPYQLLAHITQVTTVSGHGLVAQLRDGPVVYFGDTTRLPAKWAAATAVLSNSGSDGASYIDVTDPVRPAAGASSSSGSSTAGVGAPSTDTTATSGG